ncbi:hypothetical protein F7725_007642, partial [Dissostichus mawsoni]
MEEDAGLEIKAPSDLSTIDEPATQPKHGSFPPTTLAGKPRCFSVRWYGLFPWLEYSTSRDAVFCKACRHFPEATTVDRFIKTGFKDWKHISQCCLNNDACNRSFVERNREHIKVVIDLVLFCAKQGIPLRGHRENEEALNRGNFLELFPKISHYDPEIKRRLDDLPGNGKLTSPDIQNEILQIAASLLIRKIKTELHDETDSFYAILEDEFKDVSKRELVAVCIRYMHKGMIKERTVGFLETGDMDANAISAKILQVLEPLQLDPKLCVGFGFDGASVMSGNKGGVHMILKKKFPHAIYVHCHSQRLNLVLCAASKVSPGISTFFDVINNLQSFMTGTRRHARFIEIQKELRPGKPTLELERSCDVRWSSWSCAVSKVLTLLGPILETLADFSQSSGHSKIKANYFSRCRRKKCVFILVMFNRLFEMSEYATKGLQCSTISLTDCIDLIEGLKENYTTLRKTEADFIKLVTLTDDLMKKHDIINWDVTGSRKRRLPGKFGDSQIESTLGKASPVKDNSDLKNIRNHVLDRQIMELDTRFKADTYGFMRAAAALLPRSSTFGNNESIHPASTHFSICVEVAEHEVFVQQLKRKVTAGITFPSLVEVLDSCPTDIFPQMNRLLRALVTLPITSCTVERVFSTVI